MMKLMSLILSLRAGLAATVTDVDGDSIEIEDSLMTMYTMDEDSFDSTWFTMDDRVMGGQSYSYSQYKDGWGIFNGTAVGEGGGFSLISTINFTNNSGSSRVY